MNQILCDHCREYEKASKVIEKKKPTGVGVECNRIMECSVSTIKTKDIKCMVFAGIRKGGSG